MYGWGKKMGNYGERKLSYESLLSSVILLNENKFPVKMKQEV